MSVWERRDGAAVGAERQEAARHAQQKQAPASLLVQAAAHNRHSPAVQLHHNLAAAVVVDNLKLADVACRGEGHGKLCLNTRSHH